MYASRARLRAWLTAGAATLLAAPLVIVGLAAPASAETNVVSPDNRAEWGSLAYDCTNDAVDLPTTQAFVTGPKTPPSGTGSLKFDLSGKDGNFTDLFRTDSYDGVALEDVSALSYSTYVETDGSQPPYLRLSIDTDDDGTPDQALYFYPSRNATQQAIATGVWQTWDVVNGLVSVNDDQSAPMTWEAYLLANPAATIVESFAGGPEAGGLTVGTGCGGDGTAASVTYVDLIAITTAADGVEKFDLEPAAHARTLTVTPTSGRPGTELTVTGTDCYEPTASVSIGQSFGQSGSEIAQQSATPSGGTFTAKITVPADADPAGNYVVAATCGSGDNVAFYYSSKAFDVTPNPSTPTGDNGYRMVAGDGGIFTFGERTFHGSTGAMTLNKPIVGGATDKSDYDGYWIVASDGGVFSFNAPFYGSLGGKVLSSPAVEIEPTPTGTGYWIVQADGTVTPFGTAKHYGDMKTKALNKPVIGMSVAPDGEGYWLVAQDGGIFTFGSAQFYGSMGANKLNAPVIDLAPMPDGKGYYLIGGDGGVFTFGTAQFWGSTGAMKLNAPVVAALTTPSGTGYWLAASDGGIFTFGSNIEFLGSMGAKKLNSPVLDLIN